MSVVTPHPILRAPGQYTRAIVHRLRMGTIVTLGLLAVVTASFGRDLGLHSPWFLGGEIALLVTILAISRFVLPFVDRHDQGATGEEQVGALLEALTDDGWLTVHDVTFGHGNVDHVLVGPGGVFTVETKSHPGPVKVGRIHGATIAQAQAQRRTIEAVVGTRVQPLLVYSQAWVDRPLARRRGVRVLPARMLTGYLHTRHKILAGEDVVVIRGRILTALSSPERAARGEPRQ